MMMAKKSIITMRRRPESMQCFERTAFMKIEGNEKFVVVSVVLLLWNCVCVTVEDLHDKNILKYLKHHSNHFITRYNMLY
jgi:hypothetical protein